MHAHCLGRGAWGFAGRRMEGRFPIFFFFIPGYGDGRGPLLAAKLHQHPGVNAQEYRTDGHLMSCYRPRCGLCRSVGFGKIFQC